MCNGCTGPDASHCSACIENAISVDGRCQCPDDREGEACEIYIGECYELCIGCDGPLSRDCEACVENATRDLNEICMCNSGYGPPACSVYIGECHPACDGCYGPLASDCDTCGHNAYILEGEDACACIYNSILVDNPRTGVRGCVCNVGYGDPECTVYIGACHPLCDGCHGPLESDCEACADNSYIPEGGDSCTCVENSKFIEDACVCNEGYGPPWCTIYSGVCHPLCNGCYHGPLASDCDACAANSYIPEGGDSCVCVENAEFVVDACVCSENWSGQHCLDYNYVGECFERCLECVGPDSHECTSCKENSSLDKGSCVCNVGLHGDLCDEVIICDRICSSCTGTSVADCFTCVENASFVDGICRCNENWTGADCSIWNGPCPETCETCSSSTVCTSCVENAKLLGTDCVCVENSSFEDGICRCNENWAGADCSIWDGPCPGTCETCSSSTVCTSCAENAKLFGTDCVCVENSSFVDGICRCSENWTGNHCAIWDGPCPEKCETCSSSSVCTSCVEHAKFFGTDCVCVENSSFVEGICRCNENWTGADCSIWDGPCPETCETCSSSTVCTSCVEHAELFGTDCFCVDNSSFVDGTCRCAENWTGAHCAIWEGPCPMKCDTCSSPTTCTSCVEHAQLSGTDCVCVSQYIGESCQTYTGPCTDLCAACSGPEEHECIECITNAEIVLGVC